MFDALPETKGKGGILGGRAVSTAVLGHGLAILFAISASVLAGVDPGEDPPLPWDHTVIIVLEPPPLGTNPDAGGKGPRAPEIQATRTPPPEPAEPVQPRAIPDPDPQLDEPTQCDLSVIQRGGNDAFRPHAFDWPGQETQHSSPFDSRDRRQCQPVNLARRPHHQQ